MADCQDYVEILLPDEFGLLAYCSYLEVCNFFLYQEMFEVIEFREQLHKFC